MVAVRLVGLAILVWGVTTEVRPEGSGAHLGAWLLVATLVVAWTTWTLAPGSPRRLAIVLAWLAAAGGAVAVFAPVALAFVGTAGLGAGMAFELPATLAIGVWGPAAATVATLVAGRPASHLISVTAAALAGLAVGTGRRQSAERTRQAAQVAVEQERAEIERARAGMLAERNRLAREVHDVLAHTLGALSVQLEALAAQLESVPESPAFVREGLERTKALAADGLDEARRAVRALRDDAEPLDAQVRKLCALHGADLTVDGSPRRLAPEATLALYRVAQESLTNAAKHAPGAATAVRLGYGGDEVTVSVENGPAAEAPGPLAASGAGFGIDGIRERLRLLGGELTAGPSGGGWCVDARLPL